MARYINIEVDDAYFDSLSDEKKQQVKKEFADNLFENFLKTKKSFEVKGKNGETIIKAKPLDTTHTVEMTDGKGRHIGTANEITTYEKLLDAYDKKEAELLKPEKILENNMDLFTFIINSPRWNPGRVNDPAVVQQLTEIINRDSSYREKIGTLNDIYEMNNFINNKIQGGQFSEKESFSLDKFSKDTIEFIRAREEITKTRTRSHEQTRNGREPDPHSGLRKRYSKVMSDLAGIYRDWMLENVVRSCVDKTLQTISYKNEDEPTLEEKNAKATALVKTMMRLAKIAEKEPHQTQLDLINAGIIKIPKELRAMKTELSDAGSLLAAKQGLAKIAKIKSGELKVSKMNTSKLQEKMKQEAKELNSGQVSRSDSGGRDGL